MQAYTVVLSCFELFPVRRGIIALAERTQPTVAHSYALKNVECFVCTWTAVRQHNDRVVKQLSLRETMDGDCVLWLGQAITRSLDTLERCIPTQLPDYCLCLS